jgi:hypothetical protein
VKNKFILFYSKLYPIDFELNAIQSFVQTSINTIMCKH